MSDSFPGAGDLADDARQLLAELDRDTLEPAAINADCRPPVDVFETNSALEVVVDLPGVPPESIRVAVRRSTLLIVGAKPAAPTDAAARFHVAERSYGRFARIIRLNGAFDVARANAVTRAGQLHITLPRLDDQHGGIRRISVERE